MNIELNNFFTVAQQALRNGPSGADTVLQVEGEQLQGRQWKALGTRSQAFKQANTTARQALVDALCTEFGGVDFQRLPEGVRKILKLNDFAFDAQGKVTSGRPLTARRVMAIATSLQSLNEAEKAQLANLNAQKLGAHITLVDKIAVVKELARPNSSAFQAVLPVKMRHALIAFDLLEDILAEGGLAFPKHGAPLAKLDRFVHDLAKRVGSRLKEIFVVCNRYKEGDQPVPPEIARYGKHDFGMADQDDVLRCIFQALRARNPEIDVALRTYDMDAFEALCDEVSDEKEALTLRIGALCADAEKLQAKGQTAAYKEQMCRVQPFVVGRDACDTRLGLLSWIGNTRAALPA